MRLRNSKKVMVFDDDPELLREMKEVLKFCGYRTHVTTNSVLAKYKVKTIMPDIIILDLNLKPKNGFEIYDELKKFPETSRIPFIGISGCESLIERGKSCIPMSIMRKPFYPLEIIYQIENELKFREREENKDEPGKTRNSK